MPDSDIIDQLEKMAEIGESWYHKIPPEILDENMFRHIVINLETGEYVIGDTDSEANSAYEEQFGDTLSWGVRIGEPISV